jgi:hypothetical protein
MTTGGKLHNCFANPLYTDGATVTPSKQDLQDKAKHFANTVFVIGAGVIMFAASMLQPHTMQWIGGATGEQLPFIAGTLLIVLLALKRPAFALYALARQCREYGHVLNEGTTTCERCFQDVDTGSKESN